MTEPLPKDIEELKARDFDEQEVNALAAAVIEKDHEGAQLMRQIEQAHVGFDLLAELHLTMGHHRTVPAAYVAALQVIAAKFRVDRVVLFTRIRSGVSPFRVAHHVGYGQSAAPDGDDRLQAVDRLEHMFDARVLTANGHALGSREAPVAGGLELGHALGVDSFVAVPILVRAEPIAVLVAGRVPRDSAPTDTRIEPECVPLFQAVAAMMAATVGRILDETDELALEIQLSGGFAHEMRNALSASRIMLSSAFRDAGSASGPGESLCEANVRAVRDYVVAVKDGLGEEHRDELLRMFRVVATNENRLHEILLESKAATEHALAITGEVLEYSRIGNAPPGRELVPVDEVAERALRMLAPQLEAERICVVRALQPATHAADAKHVLSIITNLVQNAYHALRNVEHERSLAVSCAAVGGEVTLVVEDNGEGIAEENLGRIFEPFFSSRPDTGTGLGLPLVKKLSGLYRGHVRVDSIRGRGTRVTIIFERHEAAATSCDVRSAGGL